MQGERNIAKTCEISQTCIFQALFRAGRTPDPAELAITHANPARPRARYAEGPLNGFVDHYDENVYAAAAERFWADARRTRCV